jgi:hypothetical protein
MTTIGSAPTQIAWNVTRGDTSTIRVYFLENDESTPVDISTWDIIATAYNVKKKTTDDLEITVGTGYIDVTATSDITIEWGTGFGSIIGTLFFDIQTTINDVVWTPVVGNITVIGNVSGVL